MELMNEGLIVFDLEAASPEETVSKIARVMEEQGRLNDRAAYVADVIKREEGAPTSIGFLIATPHAKSVHVKEPSLAFARLKDPGQGDKHLEILAKLSRKIIHDDFREQLMNVTNEKEVLELIL